MAKSHFKTQSSICAMEKYYPKLLEAFWHPGVFQFDVHTTKLKLSATTAQPNSNFRGSLGG